MQQTSLYNEHIKANGKMVDFAGWQMPIHYGSQLEEHHSVRKSAGMFDVSHMTVVDIKGSNSKQFLQYLLANDVAKLVDGKALYSCMLNDKAGVIDDLIVYKRQDNSYRIVVNAATKTKDLAWIRQHAALFAVTIDLRDDLSMIAIQGPKARELFAATQPESTANQALQLKIFWALFINDMTIARTGYTGEDGFEVILPHKEAIQLWQQLNKQGVQPCGLGARDTLRLEAGMNLYGHDMTETTSPLTSGLSWTIAMQGERNFIGRSALEQQKSQGVEQQLVGLVLEDKGILRDEQTVILENANGTITSGGFSPSLNLSIALARIPKKATNKCLVAIRKKQLKAKIVKPPFVRFGKKTYQEMN